jgi:hypothetical protein
MNLSAELYPIYDWQTTAAIWTLVNPVIPLRQTGVVTDAVDAAHSIKMGDGITAWSDLPFIGAGAPGVKGDPGVSAYVYIAYAADASGTGFTTTFSASLNYIAVKTSTLALIPIASDFTGLWFNYKGGAGTPGSNGSNAYIYVAYASDASGTGFTTTFNAALNYIAIKSSTVSLTPVASNFAGLWYNYKGATGAAATVAVGTVTTGAAGTSVIVTNVGTSSAAVFNFTIPQGAAGANGQGVPTSGSTNDILVKNSSTNYDTKWFSLTNLIAAVVSTILNQIFLISHPINSLYMTVATDETTTTQMATKYGGTWAAWGAGCVPLGIGNNGTTNYSAVEQPGGAETVTIGANNLPATIPVAYASASGALNGAILSSAIWTNGASYTYANLKINSSNGALSIIQPYLTCYIWKRTA